MENKCETCKGEYWIHHQHPTKPVGVIMSSTPCPNCNPQGHIPNKLCKTNWTWYTTYPTSDKK